MEIAPARPLQFARVLSFAQGGYYILGGLWPLLHLSSFEIVTGEKCDDWLVRTVAGVLLVMGTVLLYPLLRSGNPDRGARSMAFGISGVLAAVAITSSLTGRISMLYLVDGGVHLMFSVGWLYVLLSREREVIGSRS